MKRIFALVLVLTVLVGGVVPLWAQGSASAVAPVVKEDSETIRRMAETVTAITGMAISPLLGTGGYGAYRYFTTAEEQRGSLPWFAKVGFWLPALLIVGACAAKDALGAALPPGWKKPLDILETVENQATGLVAAGAVVPFTLTSLSGMIFSGGGVASGSASGLMPSGLASIQVAAIDFSWLLNLLTIPFGVAVFVVVWMAAHAINVLILISPWGAIDAVLKVARTGVLGLLTVTSAIDPEIAALMSLGLILLAWLVAGWAFRLTIFGSAFCYDFFTWRRRRFEVAPDANKVFSAGKLTVQKVPLRTYGRLVKGEAGQLEFVFKPWLVMPEKRVTVENPAELVVGRGMVFSLIQREDGGVFFLPPRYRTHEEDLAAAYGFRGVEPAGLRKAWGWIAETMGFSLKVPAPGAAGT